MSNSLFGRKGLVFDIETSGLLPDIREMWCISFLDMVTDHKITLSGPSLTAHNIKEIFSQHTDKPIIGHNIISYDIPAIDLLYGIDLNKIYSRNQVIDTLILSKVLYPDRPLPHGCPSSVYNSELKIRRDIGPHGLESWGYRVGETKIEIHDWLNFHPSIIDRCEIDVSINARVYYRLMSEAGITIE